MVVSQKNIKKSRWRLLFFGNTSKKVFNNYWLKIKHWKKSFRLFHPSPKSIVQWRNAWTLICGQDLSRFYFRYPDITRRKGSIETRATWYRFSGFTAPLLNFNFFAGKIIEIFNTIPNRMFILLYSSLQYSCFNHCKIHLSSINTQTRKPKGVSIFDYKFSTHSCLSFVTWFLCMKKNTYGSPSIMRYTTLYDVIWLCILDLSTVLGHLDLLYLWNILKKLIALVKLVYNSPWTWLLGKNWIFC